MEDKDHDSVNFGTDNESSRTLVDLESEVDGSEMSYSEFDCDENGGNIDDNIRKQDYPGLWTPVANHAQSKTWVSAEEQMRARYKKCISNIHHMGADRSPYVPRSFKEWVELRAHYLQDKETFYELKIDQLNQELYTRRVNICTKEDPTLPLWSDITTRLAEKLQAITKADSFTTTLLQRTIWHDNFTHNSVTDWPTYSDLKAHGDRVKQRFWKGRALPPPRLRRLASEHAHLAQGDDAIAAEGQEVPYEYREIAAWMDFVDLIENCPSHLRNVQDFSRLPPSRTMELAMCKHSAT
ncbi:hypothetical protein BX600DRAFT_451605 [Xylariales sp. PMI_506]|nr:hypothetical protein BX600DRAFT_451605 [Xylariales sp. PMI_506]